MLWPVQGDHVGSRIPIFPLHTLLLPTLDLGIHVFEQRYRDLIAYSLSNGHTFGVVLIGHGREVGGPAETHAIGTLAQISGYAKLPDGRYLLEVEGTQRFRIHGSHREGSYPTAEVSFMSEPIGNFAAARANSLDVEDLFTFYRNTCGEDDLPVHLPVDPVARSYMVASLLRIDTPEKQQLLEIGSASDRLAAEREILRREIALLSHIHASR
jgi:Lon protease-like protein